MIVNHHICMKLSRYFIGSIYIVPVAEFNAYPSLNNVLMIKARNVIRNITKSSLSRLRELSLISLSAMLLIKYRLPNIRERYNTARPKIKFQGSNSASRQIGR